MKKIILTGVLLLSVTSFSQEIDNKSQKPTNINQKPKINNRDFKASIGVMPLYSTNLYKKRKNSPTVVPIVSVSYKNLYLSGTELGYKYIINKDLTITGFAQFLGGVPLIGGSGGISGKAIDNKDMKDGYKNIEDRDTQIEGGIKVNYNTEWERVRLSGIVKGGANGGSAKVGIMQPYRFGQKLFVFPELSFTMMNANMVEHYFGITQKEVNKDSSDKLDKVYEPSKLGYATTLGIGYSYGFNQHWGLFGTLSVQRLSDEIYNSPIVRDKTNYVAGIGLKYTF